MRILVVEDDPRVGEILTDALALEGYTAVVAGSGQEGVDRSVDPEVGLAILDVMLPDIDGFDVLRRLRARRPDLPVLMLTARDDLPSKVAGLEAGADDYLTKPFALEELLARVRALLRRQGRLRAGRLTLDLTTRSVRVGDRTLDLTGRECALLEFFLRRPDQTLSRRDLLRGVWQMDFDPGSTVVETTLARLRRKLAAAGAAVTIETVRGAGYRLAVRE
ncbi:MAG: response regulator transcription factor [Armatimonadota bacterium]|nr:response regulator transcription factor [Armatimonadota bacterium]MDR7438155.1 response regulator transcription factor [Armatimonadota bacterium]MDR7471436.1 response regulator transcription factor [Armatimonadota bacterium]MDR7508111.1 response regulator transcription factor [Armatimonadota bacterium]MDR7510296.1 response regulator transcription factor [Armatimonadota bacterium]